MSDEIFGIPHQELERLANPGSRGWAAGGAFAGSTVGGNIGAWIGLQLVDTPTEAEYEILRQAGECEAGCESLLEQAKAVEQKLMKAGLALVIGSIVGGAAVGAAGAAMGAPLDLRSRAAMGAAIGGVVPIFGPGLAAIGAFIATAPPKRRENPASIASLAVASVLGLSTLGGLMYAGTRMATRSLSPKS